MTREGRPRGQKGEVHLTRLERRARRLLWAYPPAYRRERADEIIGTLLEALAARRWPRLRDVRSLAVGGLKARAAQNQQRTVGANLRVAVMAGLAIYTAFWFATYMEGVVQGFVWRVPGTEPPFGWSSWPAAVTALLAGATVVLAWTAPRIGLLAGALAAMAVGFFAVANHDTLLAHLVQVLGLAGVAALAPRAWHPSRHWLWLPGLIAVAPLIELGMGYGSVAYSWPHYTQDLTLLAVAVVGILCIGIDARLMVAVLIFFALTFVQMAVMEPYGAAIEAMMPYLLVVATLTLAGSWLLRRQSARAIKAD